MAAPIPSITLADPTVSSTGPVTMGNATFYNTGITGGTASGPTGATAGGGAAGLFSGIPWSTLLLPLVLVAGLWWWFKHRKQP